MISAILIDDEPKNTAILRKMLTEFCPDVTVSGEANNSRTGIDIIRKLKPDLVFLDIEMPYGNAFDLLDELKPIDFEVIFVTAFDNYMLKAFKYSAMDYLLKPVNIEELQSAVDRVIERRKMKQMDFRQLEMVLEAFKNPRLPLEKVALPSNHALVFHDVKDIFRCEAQKGYTLVFLKSGQKVLSSRNIKEFEEMLPETMFFRIHNSHLINLNFVSKYHRGRGGNIEMQDGTLLEVASRRKDELLARFGHKGI